MGKLIKQHHFEPPLHHVQHPIVVENRASYLAENKASSLAGVKRDRGAKHHYCCVLVAAAADFRCRMHIMGTNTFLVAFGVCLCAFSCQCADADQPLLTQVSTTRKGYCTGLDSQVFGRFGWPCCYMASNHVCLPSAASQHTTAKGAQNLWHSRNSPRKITTELLLQGK